MERDGYEDVRMSASCASAPSGDCQKMAISSLCWVTQGKGQGKNGEDTFLPQETKSNHAVVSILTHFVEDLGRVWHGCRRVVLTGGPRRESSCALGVCGCGGCLRE